MPKLPSIKEQEEKLDNFKKNREAMGSVNLRADVETEKYKSNYQKKWKKIDLILFLRL